MQIFIFKNMSKNGYLIIIYYQLLLWINKKIMKFEVNQNVYLLKMYRTLYYSVSLLAHLQSTYLITPKLLCTLYSN